MTADDVRVWADAQRADNPKAAETLDTLAELVKAADDEDSHTGRDCETVSCQMCAALARFEELTP